MDNATGDLLYLCDSSHGDSPDYVFRLETLNLSCIAWKELLARMQHGTSEGLPQELVQHIVLMAIFMVLALVGNVSILVHIFSKEAHRRPVSVFVIALAATDVLIALFSMSVEVLWEAFDEWIFGPFICKLATYMQCMLFLSTAFILMSMSYDRYEAICKPMHFSRSLTRSRMMVLCSWSLAAVLSIPQLFIFVQVEVGVHPDGTPTYECQSNGYTQEWQRKLNVTWVAICVFIAPLLFIAFCYIQIARVVWRRAVSRSTSNNDNFETVSLRRNNAPDDHLERAKTRSLQLTICIISCYLICWLPYFTFNLTNVWTDYKFKSSIPKPVQTLSQCLAWFSSCSNPLIYTIFQWDWRKTKDQPRPNGYGGLGESVRSKKSLSERRKSRVDPAVHKNWISKLTVDQPKTRSCSTDTIAMQIMDGHVAVTTQKEAREPDSDEAFL